MTPFLAAFVAWLLLFAVFITVLWFRDRPAFSQAHHFWYFSTLYWLTAACCLSAVITHHWVLAHVCTMLMVVWFLGMVDDVIGHKFGEQYSLVKRWYGDAGGTY